MMVFETQNRRYGELIQTALDGYLNDARLLPKLAEIMRYSVESGGKRLRPCMALATCEMFGGDVNAALPVACALEMIHTYSLIHDDLPCMDNDDYRRGRLSNHKMFGEGFAVLAGDGLLSLAFEVMLDALVRFLPQIPGYLHAVQAVAQGAGVFGMVAGQVMDISLTGGASEDAETLKNIHQRKTGAMLRASLLSGAYIAGASAQDIAALDAFAGHFGLLFQITDDILDVKGNFSHMGKTLGKDEKAKKLTYPALFGLEGAETLARRTAQDALACLGVFGEKAAYLWQLTAFTLERNH